MRVKPKAEKWMRIGKSVESPEIILKRINPTISADNLNARLVSENDGVIGGTIRDGSVDEKFALGSLVFDVVAAKGMCAGEPNDEIVVSDEWSKGINVDEDAAMNSKSTNPVLVAQIPTAEGIEQLLIDGHHRMFKARQDGEILIPAYVFTAEESLSLIETHPDMMAKLEENLSGMAVAMGAHDEHNLDQLRSSFDEFIEGEMRESNHDPKSLKQLRDMFNHFIDEEMIEKTQPGRSQVHVNAPFGSEELEKISKIWSSIIKDVNLTTEGRKHIAGHNFALPASRQYPIHDISHARNALARVAQHGTTAEQAKVRAAVYRKYPSLKPIDKSRAGEFDAEPDIYPNMDNLESEMIEQALRAEGMIDKETYEDDGGTRFLPDDSNSVAGKMMGFQRLLEGMDWELEHTTIDPDEARETALRVLEDDPNHYQKLRIQDDHTDDQLAMSKDTRQTELNPWDGEGYRVDLGSGQTREPGHIGFDLYPYDHGTIVHDLDQGIPLQDGSCSNVRLCNVELGDPKAILSEIHRVLMPGGQFTYEGPNDIYNYPEWTRELPGLVLTDHESKEGDVTKEGPGSNIYRQRFTRIATPDPATANDAEPRIGTAALDELPASALLDFDATSYYYSDATASGRGNRLYGYPSQGALFEKVRQQYCRKQSAADDSNPDSVDDAIRDQVHEALNPMNPNPGPPKRLKRVSKVEKMLKAGRIVPIMKANAAKQIVYGVVLAPNEIDAQDDFMEPGEIEAAAHRYLKDSRVVGAGHEKPIKAYPVESFIAPQDFEVHGQYGDQAVKAGSWVLGVKIDDPEEWSKVANGEYQGFSVGGIGLRTEV